MSKLELKHIAPYLPYGLEVVEVYRGKLINDAFIIDVVNWDGGNVGGSDASLDSFELERAFHLRDIKPILRPMSMMDDCDMEYLLLKCLENEGYKHIDVDSFEWALVQNLDNKWVRGYHVNDRYFEITISDKGVKVYTSDIDGKTSPKNISIPYDVYEYFFMRHLDVFGLIEKGLAIDKNTIE